MAGFFFREEVHPDPADLVPKGLSKEQALEAARASLKVLEACDPLTAESVEPPMRALVEQLGLSAGQAFGLLRVAVTGQKVSPPLFESMETEEGEGVGACARPPNWEELSTRIPDGLNATAAGTRISFLPKSSILRTVNPALALLFPKTQSITAIRGKNDRAERVFLGRTSTDW
jgi:hypothetical protein